MDDSVLVEAAKGGNIDAFNHLVLEHQTRVYNLAYRILGDETAAEDATQNTFLAAFSKLSGFRGGSFLSWLLTIATNQCFDTLRYHKRHPIVPLEPIDETDDTVIESPAWMADPGDGPEASFDVAELDRAIQDCINALPTEYRVVTVLVDVNGMDYDSAADIARVPLGTIKSRLARARVRLRACLMGVWELLPPSIRLNMEGN